MYTLAASIVWGVLQPSNLIAILAALALLSAVFGWRHMATRFGAASALLLILFGLLPAGQLLIKPLEDRYPKPDISGPVTGIIVLGGAEAPGLTAARDIVTLKDTGGRLTTALKLARQFPEAILMVTAGYRANDLTQAEVAARFFMDSGIDPHRMIIEVDSHNTWENAVLSRDLVGPMAGEQWILVTSAFHMPRAKAVFDAAKWGVTPYPTDYRSLPGGEFDWSLDVAARLRASDLALHEWVGLVFYRLMGRTNTL